jgi:hypothetical protein
MDKEFFFATARELWPLFTQEFRRVVDLEAARDFCGVGVVWICIV